MEAPYLTSLKEWNMHEHLEREPKQIYGWFALALMLVVSFGVIYFFYESGASPDSLLTEKNNNNEHTDTNVSTKNPAES